MTTPLMKLLAYQPSLMAVLLAVNDTDGDDLSVELVNYEGNF
ncbi:hypothetical protein OK016_22150 [Vibrio chagasii]|nr:hypothetical protein [Vibrio chagasii]